MKQDRNGVRTAQDLERKYNLADLVGLKKAVELSEEGINKTNSELENFMKSTLDTISDLENRIDGSITTYYSGGVPTLSNYPAKDWTTADLKASHVGDLYYDKATGYTYRFNESYSWERIIDKDLTEALALANSASDTADSKRRIFTTQPNTPYDNGDLWFKDGEIYICQISKAETETYADNDFIIATKYTDDTLASQTANELTVVKGQVTTITEEQDEIKVVFTETTNLVNQISGEVADEIDKREAMIRATSENGLPVVELGSTESPVKTKYKNDGMYIETNGATTSYFKNGKAYNYDMEAINSFTIGNFSWKPRANGNLSLLYTGGDD